MPPLTVDMKGTELPIVMYSKVGLIVTANFPFMLNDMVSMTVCWAGDAVAIASHTEGKIGDTFSVIVKFVVAIPDALVCAVVTSTSEPSGLFT